MDLKPFFDYVDSEGPNLRGAVSKRGNEFLGSLELIKAKLTTEVEDAYLVGEMFPVCAKVRKIKGKSLLSLSAYAKLLTVLQEARTKSWTSQRLAGVHSAT